MICSIFTAAPVKKGDVLFTLPTACATTAASPLIAQLRSWLAPYVVAERVVKSRGIGQSWQRAYSLLHDHMRAHGRMYDFVFHVRHDLFIERNITTWPGADFTRIVFQPRCVICGEDDATQRCAHNARQSDDLGAFISRVLAVIATRAPHRVAPHTHRTDTHPPPRHFRV